MAFIFLWYKILIPWQHRDYRTLTALSLGLRPRESGQLSTIIPLNHGITITYIYICLWSKKKIESYFRDRLTFSNVGSRTSRRIYRLALLLSAPETLSSLSKSRISIFNAHLTLLVRKMTSHNSIGKYRHLVN